MMEKSSMDQFTPYIISTYMVHLDVTGQYYCFQVPNLLKAYVYRCNKIGCFYKEYFPKNNNLV